MMLHKHGKHEREEVLTYESKTALKVVGILVAFLLVFSALCPGVALAYTQKEQIVNDGHGTLYNEDYLVMHETANPGATALNHVNYWKKSPYAVHYVMDLDGSVVYHTMSDDRKAWHIGNGNSKAVGIELCHATNQADFDKQWTEAVKWAGDYLHKRGWDVSHLISHNEARLKWGGTDHTDPNSYFEQYGKSWAQFKAEVAAYMNGGSVGNGGTIVQGGGTAVSGSGGGSNISSGTYTVTASALNVRTGPGVNYAKKSYGQLTANAKQHAYSNGCLKQGTRVTVYECTNGWARIPSGWVSTQYLSKSGSSSASSASGSGNYRVAVNTRLNVRSGPGTNYRITGTLSNGYVLHTVTILGNGWAKYQAYSGTRYVSAQYLKAA